MRVYNEKNIRLYYLSPYAECRAGADTVAFMQTVFDYGKQLPLRRGKGALLLRSLQRGVSYPQGVWLLFRCCGIWNAAETFRQLVSGGILE